MGAAYLNAPDVFVHQRCMKAQFPSRKAARKAIGRNLNRRAGLLVVAMGIGALNVYHCNICRHYHLGHR